VYEEYLLYDLNAILSAIGGSLGLFLGISCFHIVQGCFIAAKYQCGLVFLKNKKPKKDQQKKTDPILS
jgi:hypothetical protein